MGVGPAAHPIAIPASVGAKKATFREMSAVAFLVLLIAFAAAVTIWVVYFLLDKAPPYPQIAGMSSADVKASIENYHDLAREWRDGILDVFETVVTKAILPLVLLLFGYLFGRGAGD